MEETSLLFPRRAEIDTSAALALQLIMSLQNASPSAVLRTREKAKDNRGESNVQNVRRTLTCPEDGLQGRFNRSICRWMQVNWQVD
jgi:hypothetical protein